MERCIIIGDFNAVIDSSVNRFNKISLKVGNNHDPEIPLLDTLQHSMIDVFIMANMNSNRSNEGEDRFTR